METIWSCDHHSFRTNLDGPPGAPLGGGLGGPSKLALKGQCPGACQSAGMWMKDAQCQMPRIEKGLWDMARCFPQALPWALPVHLALLPLCSLILLAHPHDTYWPTSNP